MSDFKLFDWVSDLFHAVHATLFESLISPALRALEWAQFTESAFDATEFFLLGVVQITVLYLVVRPLELWRPAEPATRGNSSSDDRRTDVAYTLLHRLGGFALLSFALIDPLLDGAESQLRLWGINRLQLDEWTWLKDSPLVTFFVYFVVLDFVGYWLHRAQHGWHLWWQLHALHHANRNMSLWSDNRNHLLDDLLIDICMSVVAWFIGLEPAQFVLWVAASRMLQSLQHANLRWHFGWLGERLLVSPHFHRVHHGVSSGQEGRAAGCNFGVLLPWWDLLFGTGKYDAVTVIEPTGVRDQAAGRNYGAGFWQQQWLGLLRLAGKA